MSEQPSSVIELQVDKVGQLFDTLDPLPFRERDLDREAEEYIVGWARELPRHSSLRILVHMPASEASSEQARLLGQAVGRYFSYRANIATNDLRELFRIGRYSLLIGVAVLALCVASGGFLRRAFPDNQFSSILNEGFIILGWVANWRPIEIFLYDWWPILRRRNLFRRLSIAEVVISPRN
jgi:hypothetical protein